MSLLALAPALLPLAATGLLQEQEDSRSWTVFADVAYTAAGDPIQKALIVVEDGKIRSITPGASARGDSLRAASVTPGLIDLSVRIDQGLSSVEQSREIAPDQRVAETLDLFDPAWLREAQSGVTTALANPPDFNVVGGFGIAIKTAGEPDLAQRTVLVDAVLRGAIGSQPSMRNHPARGRPDDFYSRRPTTRMGVEWEWRKAVYDAAASRDDEARAFPGSDDLLRALDGQVPLMIQCWATQDIRTSVFLKEEIEREGLGRPNVILDAAAEAWREPELLVRSGVSVVLPPFPVQGRTNDGAFMTLETPKLLHELGVPIALSGHGERNPAERLSRQVGLALRGGLSFDAALAAVTIAPARMIGIDDRVGSLAVGKDADLVLWSGKPFEAASSVVGVLIDGRLIRDPRPSK